MHPGLLRAIETAAAGRMTKENRRWSITFPSHTLVLSVHENAGLGDKTDIQALHPGQKSSFRAQANISDDHTAGNKHLDAGSKSCAYSVSPGVAWAITRSIIQAQSTHCALYPSLQGQIVLKAATKKVFEQISMETKR